MIRKAIAVCVAGALVWLPGGVAGAGVTKQAVTGDVFIPTGPYRAGRALLDACSLVDVTTGWIARRDVSYDIGVDPGTYGRRFMLKADLPADLFIVFTVPSRNERVAFDRAGTAAETGRVPRDAEEAAVCLSAGPPTSFTYRTR
jgi:hypothetical protein